MQGIPDVSADHDMNPLLVDILGLFMTGLQLDGHVRLAVEIILRIVMLARVFGRRTHPQEQRVQEEQESEGGTEPEDAPPRQPEETHEGGSNCIAAALVEQAFITGEIRHFSRPLQHLNVVALFILARQMASFYQSRLHSVHIAQRPVTGIFGSSKFPSNAVTSVLNFASNHTRSQKHLIFAIKSCCW